MGVDFSFYHIIWCLGGIAPDLFHCKAHPDQVALLWEQAVGVLLGVIEQTNFALNLTYFTAQIAGRSDMAWWPMIVHPHFHVASP